jgi:2',3'-cyclic-nucleotide 2'-phosphodiesterase (5'-nucleotidase family)
MFQLKSLKMRHIKILLPLFLLVLLNACSPAKKTVAASSAPAGDDGKIEIVFLQMNDVYEITPNASDNVGGLARVATLRKQLLAKNPNTITVMAGDFISPSVTGTLKYEGKRIRGKQMVETLNALGLDWVVFGNHEFDYDDLSDLQARLDESKFNWLGGNARLKNADGTKQPFFKNVNGQKAACPDNTILNLSDADGTKVNLGLFGVLINTGRKSWVEYSDYLANAKMSYDGFQGKTDIILGLTHLAIEDDKILAGALPGVSLIMGGHEHENSRNVVGKTIVAKADANAKTVYIHTLRYDKRTQKTTINSELRKIDASIPEDPATAAVVAKWEKIKMEALGSAGFDANAKVTDLKTPLDCREVIIRTQQAPVGELVNKAMRAAATQPTDCAFFNSGSIRVDDILSGTLAEIDVVRMLPFGGGIAEIEIKGSLLRKTLETGTTNKGSGGYLQLGGIRYDEATKQWLIADKAIENNKLYKVILPEFLLTGNEQNMGFLKTKATGQGTGTDNPDIPVLRTAKAGDKADLRSDIRLALIAFLRK